MCVRGGRIKVWCLISRGAGDYFSRLERILEFKQYGGGEVGGAKAYGVKRAQTHTGTLQLPTAWARDSGFKAGSQRSPRQRARPFQMMSGPQPLLLRRIHDNKPDVIYALTLVRHWLL